jgi:hypothetical protein
MKETLLYILGSGSSCKDEELQFSLRSLSLVSGKYKVIICGKTPDFEYKNIKFIPTDDTFRRNKEANICQKILRVCEEISGSFILMNDDYIITQPTSVKKLGKPYHKGGLSESKYSGTPYSYSLAATYTKLESMGLPTLNYDVHYPTRMDAQKFIRCMKHFDWNREFEGYVVKSMYGNFYKVKATRHPIQPDCKIKPPLGYDDIIYQIKSLQMISLSDDSMNVYMRRSLPHMFPRKSIYEK